MENKEYTLRTLNDIWEILTNENIDNLFTDLKLMFKSQLALIDSLKELHPETFKDFKNTDFLLTEEVTWIDDNKHNIDFNIVTKE